MQVTDRLMAAFSRLSQALAAADPAGVREAATNFYRAREPMGAPDPELWNALGPADKEAHERIAETVAAGLSEGHARALFDGLFAASEEAVQAGRQPAHHFTRLLVHFAANNSVERELPGRERRLAVHGVMAWLSEGLRRVTSASDPRLIAVTEHALGWFESVDGVAALVALEDELQLRRKELGQHMVPSESTQDAADMVAAGQRLKGCLELRLGRIQEGFATLEATRAQGLRPASLPIGYSKKNFNQDDPVAARAMGLLECLGLGPGFTPSSIVDRSDAFCSAATLASVRLLGLALKKAGRTADAALALAMYKRWLKAATPRKA